MRHLTTFRLIDQVAKSGSIRSAAEALALAPSAVQRRLQAFEDEIGERIFERLPNGVRLNAAGELVIHHIRNQMSEMDRLKSRLADLSGIRRGHVSIACSQAVVPYFLPGAIAQYRRAFPNVSFEVHVLDHNAAEEALEDFTADIALVFDPDQPPRFRTISAVKQILQAVMSAEHPLARKRTLRLRDCTRYPLALPGALFGGRQLLERAVHHSSLEVSPVVESNSFEFLKQYVLAEQAITFQIPIGAPGATETQGLVSRPIDGRDIAPGILYMGHRPDRTLPVAVARFADEIEKDFAERFEVIA